MMNAHNPNSLTKKVKYIISIVYLLVLAIIVAGSYINQPNNQRNQNKVSTTKEGQKKGSVQHFDSELFS